MLITQTENKTKSGFTIVELLIVIAVIGVLATITVVGYGSWKRSAMTAVVKSDLNNVASAMEDYRNFNNGYPTTLPTTFSASEGVTLTMYAGGTATSYCIDGVSTEDPTIEFYIASETKDQGALEGTCGPSQGIPSVPTGLVVTSSTSTSVILSWTASTNYPLSYTAQCASDAAFIFDLRTSESPVATTSIGNLTPNTTIYCRVKALNNSGNSDWTATISSATSSILVTNGLGELGDNTNFTSLTYDSNDAPGGSQGSFVSPNGNYVFYTSSEYIPVTPTNQYVVRGWARQQTSGITTSRWYFGLVPYDIDNKAISPQYYMYRPGTTTTLSQPLNTGDTVVHLTNVSSSWYDLGDASTYFRSFIFWGYTDSTGKTWAPETYSMNGWYADIYNGGVGAVNQVNDTITLNKPWPGISYPAGHPVSNGGAGASYMYSAASNQLVSESWQEWISPTITGTTPGGLNSSTTSFPQGTRKVRISIGLNAGSPPATSRQAVSGIRFYEID